MAFTEYAHCSRCGTKLPGNWPGRCNNCQQTEVIEKQTMLMKQLAQQPAPYIPPPGPVIASAEELEAYYKKLADKKIPQVTNFGPPIQLPTGTATYYDFTGLIGVAVVGLGVYLSYCLLLFVWHNWIGF